MKNALILSLLGIASCAVSSASAQQDVSSYPNRAIRIIVATPAGGGVDAMTRVVAEKLRQRWGQNVIVENKPGAGGTTAAELISRAEPDGYTLYTTHPGPLAATAMYGKLGYNPSTLQAVAVMAVAPMVVAARSQLPLNSIREVVEYAKANPGKLNFGSSGAGTISHLTMELLKHRTGINVGHVPYRGSAPAVNDLAGGQIDAMGVDLGTIMPIAEGKRAKILGAATEQRLPTIPQVPTFQEQGFPNFVTTTWYVLVAPPKTPAAISEKLNAAVLEALRAPEAQAQMTALMVKPLIANAAATQDFIRAEAKLWTEVIETAKIRVQ